MSELNDFYLYCQYRNLFEGGPLSKIFEKSNKVQLKKELEKIGLGTICTTSFYDSLRSMLTNADEQWGDVVRDLFKELKDEGIVKSISKNVSVSKKEWSKEICLKKQETGWKTSLWLTVDIAEDETYHLYLGLWFKNWKDADIFRERYFSPREKLPVERYNILNVTLSEVEVRKNDTVERLIKRIKSNVDFCKVKKILSL